PVCYNCTTQGPCLPEPRPTRLCLCGPAGVWRYAPLGCKTPENTTIIAYRSAAAPAAASVAPKYFGGELTGFSSLLIFGQLPTMVNEEPLETIATILHADLDAFYASVEQLLDPSLRGSPIAVGGGVVLAASYEARACGVRGGMPGRRARELCPQLVFVSGHFQDYQRLGDAAIKVIKDFTPLAGG